MLALALSKGAGVRRCKVLRKISKAQAKVGAELAFHNAESLLDSASLLGKKKKFGLANSLAILSAEEAIKAYVLTIHSILPVLSQDLLCDTFSNHKTKHSAWMAMQMMMAYLELFYNTISKFKEKEERENIKPGTLRNEAISEICETLKNCTKEVPGVIDEAKAWYDSANTRKNRGLYVDRFDDQWVAPNEIDEEEFTRSKKNAKNFLKMLEEIKNEDLEKLQQVYEQYITNIQNEST